MSTDDTENLITDDLEALLGSDDLKKPEPKKAAAKKTAAKAPAKEEAKEPQESRAEIEARVRAEIEAEVRERILREMAAAEVEESEKSPKSPLPPRDDFGPDEIPPPRIDDIPEGHVLIHFVDDGFTVGEQVKYRGQEMTLDPNEEPWVRYSRRDQIRNWGREVFREGHWDGAGFDLNDPALNEEEKARLRALAR